MGQVSRSIGDVIPLGPAGGIECGAENGGRGNVRGGRVEQPGLT